VIGYKIPRSRAFHSEKPWRFSSRVSLLPQPQFTQPGQAARGRDRESNTKARSL
jgi:hypothetical protein